MIVGYARVSTDGQSVDAQREELDQAGCDKVICETASGAKTNGLAIASLICSLFFWLYGLPAILAIVFGFVARGQIRRSNGTQGGNGMAVAGIIIGFAGLAVGVLLVVLLRGYVLRHCNHQLTHCDFTTNGS